MAVPTELLEILLLSCYITILPLFNYSHPILLVNYKYVCFLFAKPQKSIKDQYSLLSRIQNQIQESHHCVFVVIIPQEEGPSPLMPEHERVHFLRHFDT